MSEKRPDVVVISAFGRGNWLAAELAGKAFSVQLVDVTDHLGRWAPEDWEGPFGFFQPDDLLSSQLARLTSEDYRDEVPEGFTVWPPEGPLDTRGLLVNHWVESLPVMTLTKPYIQTFSAATRDEAEDLGDELLARGFHENWLAQLAHQLASSTYTPNAMALMRGQPLPLFSPFFIRRVTRKGAQQSLEWAKAQGSDVLAGVKIVDVAIEGKEFTGVQLSGETSRVVSGENVVWCLSSLETQFMAPAAAAQLFEKGPLSPEWCWMRWRIQGNLGLYLGSVPRHFVLIEDLGLPWTHGNLLVVQACEIEGKFDVWARLPAHHRFQRAYCENFGAGIVAMMDRRIPNFKAQIQDQPQDYHYEIGELGPSLFPVFDAQARAGWSARRLQNLEYDGVEWVDNLDWTGRFFRQNEILAKLVKWKQVQLNKLERGGRRGRSIYPT